MSACCCLLLGPYGFGRFARLAVAEILRPCLADPYHPYLITSPSFGSACRTHRRHPRVLSACAASPVVSELAPPRGEIPCSAILAHRFRRDPAATGLALGWLAVLIGSCPVQPSRRSARAIHMPRGQKLGYSGRFLRLHAPQAVIALRLAQQSRTLPMALQLLTDLVRDQIGLGDEHRKRLLRLLPTFKPANSPLVRKRNY